MTQMAVYGSMASLLFLSTILLHYSNFMLGLQCYLPIFEIFLGLFVPLKVILVYLADPPAKLLV